MSTPIAPTMNVLSLFSGIGGLELGLERAGMTVVGQVEVDPFCRRVLEKHWPEVPRHDDVRTAPAWWWCSGDRPVVHVVAGGFPCQGFSRAGWRRGVGDERWGWPWMFDVIRAVRPRYVVVENVAALLDDSVAFGWVLGDLASVGFDAEWSVLSACAVGAPHTRERLFLVAYPDSLVWEEGMGLAARGDAAAVRATVGGIGDWRGDPMGLASARSAVGVVDGVPDELEPARARALGNAVVPQVAERVGRLILATDRRSGVAA